MDDIRILYMMHINWNWIKQRPHFLAKELSKSFDLHVVDKWNRKLGNLKTNDTLGIKLSHIPDIRFQRFGVFRSLNLMLGKHLVKSLIRSYSPDYIWLSYPMLLDYIPGNCNTKLIYDCMDDALSFANPDKKAYKKLVRYENEILQKASHIFVSSNNLAEVITKRQPCSEKISIVRNAFSGEIIPQIQMKQPAKDKYTISYFGTVSKWFDFESILYCLDNIPELEFVIVGPMPDCVPPRHERLRIEGAVEHSKLSEYADESDCFIMPFKLCELILSVDPVKLYEYINFNKPIISVYYKEIDRFGDFVNFYNNKEDLLEVIRSLINNPDKLKYTSERRTEFLSENTWQKRADIITSVLKQQDEA